MNSYLRSILTVIIIFQFVELSKSGINNPVLQDDNLDPAGEKTVCLKAFIILNDKISIQPCYNRHKSEVKFLLPDI